MNLQTFKNDLFEVAVTMENGEVLFDAEQVAINLGFARLAESGNVVVRWERVNKYIKSFYSEENNSCPQVGTGDLIPESIVYMLAFKASNELAMKFQKWLSTEVIPSIRKTGSYVKPMSEQEMIKASIKLTLENSDRLEVVESKVENLINTKTIDTSIQNKLNRKGKEKVVELLGGKLSNAYKTLSKKLFSNFWNEFNNHFTIASYRDLPLSKLDEAEYFINIWKPSTTIQLEIHKINNQLDLF